MKNHYSQGKVCKNCKVPVTNHSKGHCVNCSLKLQLRGVAVHKKLRLSEDHKHKLSLAKIGTKLSSEVKQKLAIKKLGNANAWKGDKAGYMAMHQWVYLHKGKPQKCEHCGITKGRFEWANKDHKYRRVLADYIRLCKSCHNEYDFKNRLYRRFR